MSNLGEYKRSRLKSSLNPTFRPEKYGYREKDYPIRCNMCGHKEKASWKLGDCCPQCHSDKYFPIVHIKSTRRQLRILIGTVLFIAFVMINFYTLDAMNPHKEITYPVQLYCDHAKEVFVRYLPYDQTYPVRGPRWNWWQKTAHPAYECDQKHVFGLGLSMEEQAFLALAYDLQHRSEHVDPEEIQKLQIGVACPVCQSTMIQSYQRGTL